MVPIVAPIFSFSKIVSIILCKGDRNNNLLYNNKKTYKKYLQKVVSCSIITISKEKSGLNFY